jgi:hypothetical protein
MAKQNLAPMTKANGSLDRTRKDATRSTPTRRGKTSQVQDRKTYGHIEKLSALGHTARQHIENDKSSS